MTWQADASGPGFAGAQMTAIAASGGRLEAVGSNGTGAVSWTSSDGKAWSQVTAAPDMAGAQALGVAVGATTDVAVGAAPGSAKAWSLAH